MMTSIGTESNDAEIDTDGIVAQISKPVRARELIEVIDAIVDRRPDCGPESRPHSLDADSSRSKADRTDSNAVAGGREKSPFDLVLLVEDSRVNQGVGREMLESLGCHVHLAEDGERAVEFARRGYYEAIFMDCQMPLMDGFEATSAIRENEGSGASHSDHRSHCECSGG